MRTRPLAQRLFGLLGDGQLHSGEQLAKRCTVSRSAVWKALSGLRGLGLEVESVTRRGYRLSHAVAPLDAARIRAALPAEVRARLRAGECVWTTGSTNADLMGRAAPPPGQFDFRAAEYQSAGRGRRGRSWFAPPGGAICLSIGWSFAELPAQAGALSLAMGVCLLQALRRVGVNDAALKWPNDVVLHAGVLRKLAGILCELRSEAGGPAHVVIGMGVNVALGRSVAGAVVRSGTQPASLADLGFAAARRNELIAAVLRECVRGLVRFEREGFAPFVADWRAADSLRDAPVTVHAGESVERGIARGIDAEGALLVDAGPAVRRYLSGEVSLRSGATA